MNDNIKISGTVSNDKIDNTELVEAINDMRKEFTPEAQNKVINLALRGTFLVPAVLENNQELVADENNHVQFQDRQTAKFLLINNKDSGKSFFPVFTDAEELKKIETDAQYKPFAMKFSDIANLTESTPNVIGFVLNPFNRVHNLPFTKEMLQSIKQTLIKFRQEKEAADKAMADAKDAQAPNITVSTNNEEI